MSSLAPDLDLSDGELRRVFGFTLLSRPIITQWQDGVETAGGWVGMQWMASSVRHVTLCPGRAPQRSLTIAPFATIFRVPRRLSRLPWRPWSMKVLPYFVLPSSLLFDVARRARRGRGGWILLSNLSIRMQSNIQTYEIHWLNIDYSVYLVYQSATRPSKNPKSKEISW